MHYVNYFSGTSWCTERVSGIVIYIMCRVMYCLNYFCIKIVAYICKVFIKFIHYYVFICTTVSFCCYKFVVHCRFLFSAFLNFINGIPCFVQSFLYRSHLFLKYDFLEVLITCVSLFLNLL